MISPLVSIVVPIYNSEATLHLCLDSLISQTYKNIEIICVNDCSTDCSEDIIIQYSNRDCRVKLVSHEVNKRAGGARNSGILISKGEYICLVDNDDWLTQDAIEIMVKACNQESVDIVVPQWCNYISEKKQIKMRNLIIGATKEENLHYMLMNGVRSLGCLIRRKLVVDSKLFFPENMYWEDNPIIPAWFYLARDIVPIDRVVYFYNNIPNSSSKQRSMKSMQDRVKTVDLMVENLKKVGAYSRDKSYVDFCFLRLTVYTIKMFASLPYNDAKSYLDCIKTKVYTYLPNQHFGNLSFVNQFVLKYPHVSVFFGSLLRKVYRIVK